MNIKKIILFIILALIVLVCVAGYILGNFFYTLALDPHSDKSDIFDDDENEFDEEDKLSKEEQDKLDKNFAKRNEDRVWYDSKEKEEAYISSFDDLKLYSRSIKNEASNKWAILCHGYTGDGEEMFPYAKGFYDLGFNILIPDARGHGQSEGNYIGMGWHDRLDILNWIDFIIDKDPDSEIILHGISMGGATVMMTSGEELPSNVKLVIEDCGYTSVWEEFSYHLTGIFELPEFPIMQVSSLITKIRAGYYLSEADSIKQVRKNNLPLMFIHGDKDLFVPTHMVYDLYDACDSPKELLIVEGAEHAVSQFKFNDLYWDEIRKFISKYM